MDEAFVKVDGDSARSMQLRIPQSGRWSAEIVMSAAPPVGTTVTIMVGAVRLVGTVVESMAGTYAGTTGLKVVAGYGGWSQALAARHYHNDGAGVRALAVAQDAARECGERLGTFTPVAERLGVDYTRAATVPAVKALEDAAGGNPWWVELDGTTSVGVRPEVPLDATLCPTLGYDPINRVAMLGLERLDAVTIGSVVTEHVETPQVVREIQVNVSADEPLRAKVWCGGTVNNGGRLAGLLRGIVDRLTDKPLHGVYRYRVTRMVGDRVECESARSDMPNARPLMMWPGVAGCFAELVPGAEVLLMFIDSDPRQPVIVGFAPVGSPGFVPASLVIGATSSSTEKAAAARVGDVVACAPYTAPPSEIPTQTITLVGAGAGAGTYTFSFSPVPVPGSPTPKAVLLGEIVSGSDIVEVG